ncbi:DNA polymerase epsilon, subunit B [Rozella allomycis CSF55]|uniref:DNA polymerase epsilon subunit n=1 Tax=Rozella allomycis (strain CSF55) TaxID=988480 RepID=A0A4P9YR24_ROZAC|nr:DNA polymerase epsilon, subunit B [Rozella allomycis CSF55]
MIENKRVTDIKRAILQIFTKTHGLTLQTDAVRYLLEVMQEGNIDLKSLPQILENIISTYRSTFDASDLITKESLEQVVHQIFQQNRRTRTLDALPAILKKDLDPQTHFRVINAFEMPRYKYDSFTKSFVIDNVEKSLSAKENKKWEMLKRRLQYLLGMISQIKDGCLYLEDEESNVPIDLSDANCSIGLFTEGCIVIVEGVFESGVFKVSFIGFPSDPNEENRNFVNFDYLINSNQKSFTKDVLLEVESNENAWFIFSEVHLDDQKTLQALGKILQVLNDSKPTPFALIFLGNFSSKSVNGMPMGFESYQNGFNQLAQLISKFPNLANNTNFVFIPGPEDPFGGAIYPMAPIPDSFTLKIRQICKKAHFTTNPCRIIFCTQELVFFRYDLAKKVHRNAILEPRHTDLFKSHLVSTILKSHHLLPFPLHIQPIYWDFDHSLSLFPNPNLEIHLKVSKKLKKKQFVQIQAHFRKIIFLFYAIFRTKGRLISGNGLLKEK